MGKAKEIANGITNMLFKKEEIEKHAAARKEICEGCEHISTKHETARPDVHCTVCKCNIELKIRSMITECPMGKWGAVKHETDE